MRTAGAPCELDFVKKLVNSIVSMHIHWILHLVLLNFFVNVFVTDNLAFLPVDSTLLGDAQPFCCIRQSGRTFFVFLKSKVILPKLRICLMTYVSARFLTDKLYVRITTCGTFQRWPEIPTLIVTHQLRRNSVGVKMCLFIYVLYLFFEFVYFDLS